MKTLPDNPNLNHLRRQAKDLLAGLRDTNPNATLADAQASLAEQYGFGTWADLKAEVDRRHGTADVADRAVAQAIADVYDLGRVTGDMRSMARPDEMGRRWSLETERGRWAPRTVDDLYPPGDGETDVALQQAAAAAGVLVPAPVRSRTGAVVETIAGNRWRVSEWLHSGPPLSAPVSATVARDVGRILATIHALRLPADGICGWHSIRFSQLTWSELAAKATAQRMAWSAVLIDAVRTLTDLDALDDLGSRGTHEPPVLCHNGLLPANIRLGENRRLVVSGWEHAAGLPPSWELGEALVHWTVNPNGGVNSASIRAMVDGYRSQAGTVPPLSMAMFRGSAVSLANYVSGQIELAMNTHDSDNHRSVRHLLTHLPSRSTFDEVLAIARAA